MLATSFIFFLALFALVGLASIRFSKNDTADYLVASRTIPPWLVGLSAVATNNSGYMFVGMIGYTYTDGLQTIWLMVGWILGDLASSLLMTKSFIMKANSSQSRSLGSFLANNIGSHRCQLLGKLSALITLIFLCSYAAAQFKAGGKALGVMFGWSEWTGILIGAILVLIYCFSGGIRASIWTDAAQSFVMLGGMLLLAIFGTQMAIEQESWKVLPDHYMDLMPKLGTSGFILFVLGWFFGGFSMMGQPHIVSRYLSLRSEKDLFRMRIYYYGWFSVFYALTIGVGLLCRILIPPSEGFDAESALPVLSQLLLPDVGVGLILAAIFAATMSTADSLILACTASYTEEWRHGKPDRLWIAKVVTLSILTASTAMALINSQTVFGLVLMAWGFLASAFVPLVWVSCAHRKLSQNRGIAIMLLGLGIFFLWRQMGWNSEIYEVAPSIAIASVCAWALSKKESAGKLD